MKLSRRTKALAAVAGAASIALLASGCAAGADAEDGGPVELTLATFNDFGYTDELLQEYMDENPNVTMHSAAAGRHSTIVTLLLEHGADPNARQGGGFTALHSAAQNDDRDSVEALLDSGADVALTNDEGKTPADLAGDETRDLVAVSN